MEEALDSCGFDEDGARKEGGCIVFASEDPPFWPAGAGICPLMLRDAGGSGATIATSSSRFRAGTPRVGTGALDSAAFGVVCEVSSISRVGGVEWSSCREEGSSAGAGESGWGGGAALEGGRRG